jgi:hypothetical protein
LTISYFTSDLKKHSVYIDEEIPGSVMDLRICLMCGLRRGVAEAEKSYIVQM